MIDRKKELESLESLYLSNGFEFLVMYAGRPMPVEEYGDLVMTTRAFPEEMKSI